MSRLVAPRDEPAMVQCEVSIQLVWEDRSSDTKEDPKCITGQCSQRSWRHSVIDQLHLGPRPCHWLPQARPAKSLDPGSHVVVISYS
jgi:hypothetical protein